MVKNLPAKAGDIGDAGLIPGSGRSPGEGNGSPLQYSCLEKSHRPRGLVGYSSWGRQRVGHDLATKQQRGHHLVGNRTPAGHLTWTRLLCHHSGCVPLMLNEQETPSLHVCWEGDSRRFHERVLRGWVRAEEEVQKEKKRFKAREGKLRTKCPLPTAWAVFVFTTGWRTNRNGLSHISGS